MPPLEHLDTTINSKVSEYAPVEKDSSLYFSSLRNGKKKDVDESTDTYDTIDWLVKNVPESNGRVGMIGSSYEGFTVVMALLNPHPALQVAAPESPMVDGWMGDDWFHKGAFRQGSLVYFHDQEATRASDVHWWSDHYDDYDTWLATLTQASARLDTLQTVVNELRQLCSRTDAVESREVLEVLERHRTLA